MTDALATIRSWDDLPAAFRAAVDKLNVAHEVLDTVSGLQPGYVSKLLAPVPAKGFGKMAFDLLLGATGKMLLMVDDPEALALVQGRLTQRNCSQVHTMHSNTVHIRIGSRKHKRAQRKGGVNSRKFVGKRMASKLARHAANVRWERVRLRAAAREAAQAAKLLTACAVPTEP